VEPARRVASGRNRAAAERQTSAPRSELVIGKHPVLEALRAGRTLHRILVAEGGPDALPPEIVRTAAERNISLRPVPRERLDGLADHHQGVIAEGAPYAYADFDELLAVVREAPPERPPLLLALDTVQDPQNFGSLLRTALATGAQGALLPQRRSVGVTAAVGRASAGAIEHLKIARVVNLVRALQELKRTGLWVVGLDAEGREPYDRVDLTVPAVLVVGSEGSGLGRLVADTCDVTVRLPMYGPLDSLNAAVAGSIVLYEAVRQRRALGLA
jgi:23S rRNA (guanosine2251-2'-O)-methyltransferase